MTAIQAAREERVEFAAFLERLTPRQWESRTLCELWRVREVVAHVVSFEELSHSEVIRRFLKGRLQVDRINTLGVADYADRSPQELTTLLRTYAEPHGLGAGFGGKIALVDNMIHQQDIRRSLGVPRTISLERLSIALNFARYAPLIRGAWRARGVRLVATDLDWAHGRGPEVRGSGEALLMAIAGRRDALGDLSGSGLSALSRHI